MSFFKNIFGQSKPEEKKRPDIPDFKFELVLVPGKSALDELERLEKAGESEGFRPVIIGDEEEFEFLEEQFECTEKTFDEIIKDSESIDVSEFLENKLKEDPEYYELEPGQPTPDDSVKGDLTVHLDTLTQKPKEWVFIAKIPGRDVHSIPAHFSYGGWNDCPMPEEHVAIWKYWNAKYKANIACVSHDIIEAKVENPPQTYEEAMLLAREQFIYCGDLVHQGVQTLENLATLLQNGRTWYFWWD